MSGRVLVAGFLAFAALFAAGLWYAQTYLWVSRVDGLTEIAVAGARVPVAEYRGLDGTSSPLKLRACLRLDPAALAAAPPAEKPVPLATPGWFDCFDRILAYTPDGRAWLWRQLRDET